MKKRILAIILALLLAASLLPMGALADDGVYVSVGGKAFTALDQTIYIGGGTAKLSYKYGYSTYELVMKNVKLTSFDDLGADGGVSYYAGIVYAGHDILSVQCTNCSITAPKHGSNAVYEGIYGEGFVSVQGDLVINNVDLGVEASSFEVTGARFTVNSVDGPGIVTSYLYVRPASVCTVNATGTLGVIVDEKITMEGSDAYFNVNLTADPTLGYDNAYGFLFLGDNFNGGFAECGRTHVNVTVNADYSGYRGDELLCCCGVNATSLSTENLACTLNVKGMENVAVCGVMAYTFDAGMDNGQTRCRLNLSGSHACAVGIAAICFRSRGTGSVQSIIKGGQAADVAFAVLTKKGDTYPNLHEIYASVDHPEGVAFFLPTGQQVYRYESESYNYIPLNVQLPKNGGFQSVDISEFSALSQMELPEELVDYKLATSYDVIVDENGLPANVAVINAGDSVFNDIDIPSQKNFKTAILWAVDNGVTAGITPVTFCPTDPCTRGQVVTFLWRAAGKPTPETTDNPFVDVKENSAFYKAILWAYENGIVAGLDSTHFGPSNPCTRAQVVTFLWRYAGKPAPETTDNPFTDVKSGPFYNAILWGSENKIVSGYSDDTFRPQNTCTRAQIVTFMYRYLAD